MHYRHIVFDLENTLADPGMTETGHTGNLSGRFSACTGIRPLLQGLNAMHYTVGAITCLPETEGTALHLPIHPRGKYRRKNRLSA